MRLISPGGARHAKFQGLCHRGWSGYISRSFTLKKATAMNGQ